MSSARPIGRRAFLAGAAATVAAAYGCGGDSSEDTEEVDDREGSEGGGSTLALRGMNFDTEREVWRSAFVRQEIAAIRRDLHANAVILLGSDLDRLMESAMAAADEGLAVWFEPRHFDSNAADTLAFVSDVAAAAEELRAEHPDVGLSMGVELTIFMDGLVPGSDWSERGAALGTTPPAEFNGALNAFLDDAMTTIRPIFGGQLTYSSGTWEEVDWRRFDAVGVDLYRDASNEATYVEDVRRLGRHDKPVIITEFGCCSFVGADQLGGSGFEIIDWWSDPPMVAEGTVRDEGVQARYIEELLDIYEAEGVHGAFVYNFIEPGNPYSPDPRLDLDMGGFAVVTCYSSDDDRAYERTGHFEPKLAFHAIARRFR